MHRQDPQPVEADRPVCAVWGQGSDGPVQRGHPVRYHPEAGAQRRGTERRSPMYPASFEYVAPATLEEALETLGRYEDDAKVLAGGQSLIPLMKLRFAAPRAVVDINRLPGLDTLAAGDGGLRIGALVRHKTCEKSELLARPLGDAGGGGPADLRPDHPQPRHRLRLPGPRRPPGRLGLGPAGHGRRGGRPGPGRQPHDPAAGAVRGAVRDLAGPDRDHHRGPRARPGPGRRRHLPQAGAQGRRLRHRRGGRPPGHGRRPGREGRDRPDRGRPDEPASRPRPRRPWPARS